MGDLYHELLGNAAHASLGTQLICPRGGRCMFISLKRFTVREDVPRYWHVGRGCCIVAHTHAKLPCMDYLNGWADKGQNFPFEPYDRNRYNRTPDPAPDRPHRVHLDPYKCRNSRGLASWSTTRRIRARPCDLKLFGERISSRKNHCRSPSKSTSSATRDGTDLNLEICAVDTRLFNVNA